MTKVTIDFNLKFGSLAERTDKHSTWADRTYKLRFPAGAGYGKVG